MSTLRTLVPRRVTAAVKTSSVSSVASAPLIQSRIPSAFSHTFTTATTTRRLSNVRSPLPSQSRSYSSLPGSPTPKKKEPAFPVGTLIAIFATGSGLFYLLVQQRKGQGAPVGPMPAGAQLPTRETAEKKKIERESRPGPAFNPKDVTVVFVLGGFLSNTF